ncbi:MAG: carboxypeptidase-like regulatory domain-containing protein, partial [Parabacteroides gordonii]|nr:carboxypeptidase-like regulatory domain-containing protein [Parabacteroides gordonii]
MKSKFYLLICSFLICSTLAFAQAVKVTGTVTDKLGPVTGAAVVVKNSVVGTVTDIDGNYEIEAPKNGTLVFSFVGYETVERPIGNLKVINVEMSDDVKLIDEVVVTAIGIKQQKKKLGYT